MYGRVLGLHEVARHLQRRSAGKCTSAPVVSAVPAIYNVTPGPSEPTAATVNDLWAHQLQ